MKGKNANNMNKNDMSNKENQSNEVRLPVMSEEKSDQSGKSFLVVGADLEKKTLGFLETDGFVPFVNALDAILKAANIFIVNYEKLGNGIIGVCFIGDIGSVRIAIDAGIDAASKAGSRRFRGAVIANVNPGLVNLIVS